MLLQAIVFDFDGVIADTEPVHMQAFQDELRRFGLSLTKEDYLERYLGYTDQEGFAAVARDQGRVLTQDEIDTLISRKTVRVQELFATLPLVFDGVPDRIREWAPQVPVAIASGALRAEIVALLRATGLGDSFLTIVSADDPVESKPSPQPYLLAMNQLGVLAGPEGGLVPSHCVAIEDSKWGIVAAKQAGMRVIGVTTSYDASQLEGADLVVDGVASLSLTMVERVVSGLA